MPTITEGKLTFAFPEGWEASKYDEWTFYSKQFQKVCEGTKAIDILAVAPKVCCWTIEVKDYRQDRRTKPSGLAEEIAEKVRDSLAGLAAARLHANDADEKRCAEIALRCPDLRVVLHLEQPAKHSALHPRAISPANVLQRLKQLLKAIDPHPLVVEMNYMPHIPWSVTST